ncbi:hypothetical protein INT45_000302 [Circinella minor]|uniref:Uncharacterized protein n=1 Tax=Circinella minor TaxID=1195481 RepID=A0A8H7VIM7_9FUNG|nr:hypothetical protein INT45_000302 [Circinella minor]
MINTNHRDLTKLASQLHSEHDRQHYTKVISMAEQLQLQIQDLQKIKTPRKSNPDAITAGNDKYDDTSSTSSTSTVAKNNKQPLDRYYRLLERSQSIQKQLHRISTEYSLPPAPPPHPPPSFPPPSLSATPPKPPRKTTLDTRLPSTPPPTPQKDDPLITPPASPQIKQVRFQEYQQVDNMVTVADNNNNIDDNHDGGREKQDDNESPLPPLPPPRELPPITHVQKKINGLKGFLTRTYQLSNNLVVSRAHITPLRLFTATEILTGKPKAVLKIVITAHHDYGFSFYWPSSPSITNNNSSTTLTTPAQPSPTSTVLTKPNRSQDVAKFGLMPDSLVLDALDSWIQQQGGVLPPLYQATHILREGIKIYVVYNRYHFNL